MTLEAVLLWVVTTAAPTPAFSHALLASARVDTTISVASTAQFRLDASAGRVSIGVWDRSAVRIVAIPLAGTSVRIESTPNLLSVAGSADGSIDEAEYEITVPRRMAVTVGNGDLAIEIAPMRLVDREEPRIARPTSRRGTTRAAFRPIEPRAG